MNRLAHIVAKNSVLGLIAQMAIKVISFLFTLFVVRRLGAEVYGQYAAILAFCGSFAIFSDLGLSLSAVRMIARWQDDPDGQARTEALYGNLIWLRLALSLFTSLLLIGTAFLTDRPLVMVGAIALNCINIFTFSIHGVTEAVLAGRERLDLSYGPKVIQQVLFVAGGSLALYLGWGYYGLTLASTLGVAVMTWLNWQYVRRLGFRPQAPRPGDWPALLKHSLPFGIIGLALGLSYRFDTILLNLYRSDIETGIYNAAYNLVFSTVVISNVFNTALYPSLSREIVTGREEKIPGLVEKILRYLLIVALPIAVGIAILADQLVPLLYDSGYSQTVPALRLIIWTVPFMFLSEFLGYVIVVSGEERKTARVIVVSSLINITVNALLIPRFGFMAAAAMTVATEMIVVGQYLYQLRGVFSKIALVEWLVRPAAAAGMMAGAVFLVRGWLPLFGSVAFGAAVYLGLLLAFRALRKEDLQTALLILTRRAKVSTPAGD